MSKRSRNETETETPKDGADESSGGNNNKRLKKDKSDPAASTPAEWEARYVELKQEMSSILIKFEEFKKSVKNKSPQEQEQEDLDESFEEMKLPRLRIFQTFKYKVPVKCTMRNSGAMKHMTEEQKNKMVETDIRVLCEPPKKKSDPLDPKIWYMMASDLYLITHSTKSNMAKQVKGHVCDLTQRSERRIRGIRNVSQVLNMAGIQRMGTFFVRKSNKDAAQAKNGLIWLAQNILRRYATQAEIQSFCQAVCVPLESLDKKEQQPQEEPKDKKPLLMLLPPAHEQEALAPKSPMAIQEAAVATTIAMEIDQIDKASAPAAKSIISDNIHQQLAAALHAANDLNI